jgi:hypothetical protein
VGKDKKIENLGLVGFLNCDYLAKFSRNFCCLRKTEQN